MMTVEVQGILNDHWERLEEESTTGPHRVRTSNLPIVTSAGNLMAAVDHEGYRHLLVPLSANQHLRRGRGGTALLLRERPLENADVYERYADLGCLRKDLNEVFTGLCTDVLSAIEGEPVRPLKAMYLILDRWRALFQNPAPLGPDQLAGLFGELVVLNRLLGLNSVATDFWSGPSGHRHDFTVGRRAIEIKTSTTSEGRRVRIHGLDQLQAPQDGTLDLVWIRLARVDAGGQDIADLAESARQSADDENGLLLKLAQAGYRSTEADLYRNTRFQVVEEFWYEVDEKFPKLDPPSIRSELLDIHYSIELADERPHVSTEALIHARLESMMQEIA